MTVVIADSLSNGDQPSVGNPPDSNTSRNLNRSRLRFVWATVIALAIVGIPYLWILTDLWTGSANLFRHISPSDIYDLQGRAMLSGHFYVPNGSLGIEAFLNHGHQYTYFGIFPSILRLPVLAVTHSFDGRLTAPSLLLAWVFTGLFTSLLLWRVRIQIRGDAVLGMAEAVCCGVFVAVVNGGSVLLYLAASPKVAHEDLAWSVALTMGVLFSLLGVAERPSPRRMVLAALLVVCAALDRSPTGYACIIATLLVAGWFALGRAGRERRRVAVPVAVIGLGALVLDGLVNWVKLGMPYGLSEANQVWTQVNAHRRLYLASNGGNAFAFHYLPSTLVAYLQPFGISLSSHFPFLSLPTGPAKAVGAVVLDQVYPTASIPASMPLLFLFGIWGVITAFRPHPVGRVQVMRLLLVAVAAGTAGVLLFGYIADRYLADFLPFLALASMIGLVDIWRRFDGEGRRARSIAVAVIAALGLFGIWVNIGAAITPTGLWTSAQAQAFVWQQRSLGGTPTVLTGSELPYWAPAGTLFATGSCSGLYLSNGFDFSTVPGQQLQHETWIPVEQPTGTVHVLEATWNGPIEAGGSPVTIATYGSTRVELEPTGTNRVRMVLRGPDLPSLPYPASDTSSVTLEPGVPTTFVVTADPNLKSIEASGLGVAIQYPLPGSGPFEVPTDPTVQVVARTSPGSSMSLCHQLTSAK
jgi:hypothetical protein